jgi:hypothetical protein
MTNAQISKATKTIVGLAEQNANQAAHVLVAHVNQNVFPIKHIAITLVLTYKPAKIIAGPAEKLVLPQKLAPADLA